MKWTRLRYTTSPNSCSPWIDLYTPDQRHTPRTQWPINNPHLPLILFCPFSSAIFLALAFYGPLSRSKLVEESTQHWNKSAFKFCWAPGIGFNSALYSNLRLLSCLSTHSSRYCVYGHWDIVIVLRSKIKVNQVYDDNIKICLISWRSRLPTIILINYIFIFWRSFVHFIIMGNWVWDKCTK